MSYRYLLTINGLGIQKYVPLDVTPLHISMVGAGGGTSQMTFTIEDPTGSTVALPYGAHVELRDTAAAYGLRFRGLLLQQEQRPRPSGTGRFVECTAVGFEWMMDVRQITQYKSRDKNGQLLTKDDEIVKALMDNAGLQTWYEGGWVQRTNSQMELDEVYLSGQSIREALDELADLAQPETSTSVRRWYIDANGHLHWYSGTEGLAAPFRVADGSYMRNLLTASGIVSVWSGQPKLPTQLLDHRNYAAALLDGGYTTGLASLCLNEPQLQSVAMNGSTGYASATGANLHPGDTFTLGISVRRAATGNQMLFSGGANNEYALYFSDLGKLVLHKHNVGDIFVTTDSFSSTTNVYHIVVTKSGATTAVYVNGVAQAGTTTNQTIVASAGATVYIGVNFNGTAHFNGRWWGAFIASTAFSAATVLALYNQWASVVPENLVVSYDSTGVRKRVYIMGANAEGSGWVPGDGQPGTGGELSFGNFEPQAFLRRDGSDTARKRKKHGNAFLATNDTTILACQFQVTLDPAVIQIPNANSVSVLRPGQVMYITNAALGLSAHPTEIKQVEMDLNLGNGIPTFEVYTGALPYSGLRGRKRQ